jgi:hypothetical protein
MGVQAAAAEKRASIEARVAKMREIVDEAPGEHFLLWHDLEAERRAIATAVPDAVSVWGSQDLDEREQAIIDFSEGRIQYLSTKPVIAGSGCNFQRHCHRAIFTGIGFKFADFIQAIHRIQRFQQTRAGPDRPDLHRGRGRDPQAARAEVARPRTPRRADDRHHPRARPVARGDRRRPAPHDGRRPRGARRRRLPAGPQRRGARDARHGADSVGLIVTSIPFSSQYEYSPSFNDFGHNEDNAAFWRTWTS